MNGWLAQKTVILGGARLGFGVSNIGRWVGRCAERAILVLRYWLVIFTATMAWVGRDTYITYIHTLHYIRKKHRKRHFGSGAVGIIFARDSFVISIHRTKSLHRYHRRQKRSIYNMPI